MINSKLSTIAVLLGTCIVQGIQGLPTVLTDVPKESLALRGAGDDWKTTLSNDTHFRLEVALDHLSDLSPQGQAFRNDTIMRINIEREALGLSLIDLSQAFGMTLPADRSVISRPRTNKRNDNTIIHDRDVDDEPVREFAYLRGGAMGIHKRDTDAEPVREFAYLRGGAMGIHKRDTDAEPVREFAYLRGGAMGIHKRDTDAEPVREFAYLRGGAMGIHKRDTDSDNVYSNLANDDNLALGAMERVNIAYRVQGKPELTLDHVKELASHGDDYISSYWNASMTHGGFWTTDQDPGQAKPNFVEGGQDNGFGFTQSHYHKLHCLANLRIILSWHINGKAENMSRDMNVHTIHCLEYIRERELRDPDLNEEPIDTVDYKGMGIH